MKYLSPELQNPVSVFTYNVFTKLEFDAKNVFKYQNHA